MAIPATNPRANSGRTNQNRTAPDSRERGIGNIRVTRKTEQRNFPENYSYPTVRDTFNQKYNRPYLLGQDNEADRLKKYEAGQNSSTVVQRKKTDSQNTRSQSNNKIGEKIATIKSLPAKLKAVRGIWMIIGMCSLLFLVQLIFWFISLLGLGLEAGVVSTNIGGNWFTQTIIKSASKVVTLFVDPITFFAVGWIGSIIAIFCQIGIAIASFIVNKINPFRGKSLELFIILLAVYMLPFIGGAFCWGIFWILEVVKEAGKP